MDAYIFNELSTPFANIYEAKEGLKTFIQTCVKAHNLFGFQTLRLDKNIGNLYELPIAPSYTVSQLLQDSDMDKDSKDQFVNLITQTPLLSDKYPMAQEKNTLSEFKIKVNDEIKLAEGLGAAYLLETLCVSFLSHDLWNDDEIKNLEHWFLNEAGDETTQTIAVKHASKPEHLVKHQTWFEKKKREQLQKSRDLWEKRETFFPHLILCGEVEKQLSKLGIESKYLDQIIEKLKRLDQYAKDWKEGSYSEQQLTQYGLNISGESDGTLRKYGRLRQFRLPDGTKKLFEQHIKTGDLRFHFYPDDETKTIYVGYIGEHLPTIKFK